MIDTRVSTKAELHNKKLEDLTKIMREEIKGLIKQTVLKNASKFDSIDDVRFFIDKLDFKGTDLLDAGIRQSLWVELEFVKDEERKKRKGKKLKTKKTWENVRK